MGSVIGKGILKKVVDPQIWNLVDNFSSFLAVYKDEATAALFHEDVVKILGKAAVLYQQNQIGDDAIKEMSKLGLRASLVIIDYFQMSSLFDAMFIIKIIQDTQTALDQILQPKLTPKNYLRIPRTLSLFSDEKLLADLFTKNKWRELSEIVVVLRANLGHLHP